MTCIHIHSQSFEAGFAARPSRVSKADRARIVFMGRVLSDSGKLSAGNWLDEPESLILAQSERWRHA